MALEIHKVALPSNKPPKSQQASPDPDIFTTSTTFHDGRVVWRSIPRPDRLGLVGYLLPAHFANSLEPKPHLPLKAEEFADGLRGGYEALTGKKPRPSFGKMLVRIDVPLGDRGATVHIELTSETAEGEPLPHYKLRLEFNPRRVGKAGCNQLQFFLEAAASSTFAFGRYLADAKLTRLDVAIDYLGVKPADLIVTAKNEGKRLSYSGDDGQLETLMIFEKKAPTKGRPLGKLLAKTYDKNRERQARGLSPPYPGRDLTRLEFERRRFKPGFGLTEIPTLAPTFAAVRVSYRDGLVANPSLKSWRIYCGLRHAFGHAEAMAVLGTTPFFAPTERAKFEGHPSDLLALAAWSEFPKGLEVTGLSQLIALAASQKIS